MSLCREGSWGSGNIVPRTPKLCTIWMCVVSFRPPLPYFRRRSPRHQLNRRVGGPQCLSEKCGGEKTVLLPRGIEFWTLGRRAHSLVAMPFELSRPFYAQRLDRMPPDVITHSKIPCLCWKSGHSPANSLSIYGLGLPGSKNGNVLVSIWPTEHRRKY